MSTNSTFPEEIPKMTVSDKNGTVSASIKETNRIRALLGLKPLNVGSSSSTSSSNSNNHNNNNTNNNKKQDILNNDCELEKEKENENEIYALYNKLHLKHKLKQKQLRGISLAEELLQTNNFDNFNAIDWVKKSRNLEKEKLKINKKNKINFKNNNNIHLLNDDDDDDDIDDNIKSDLSGKVIKHNINEFKKGDTKILILKDRSILDNNCNINNDEDELINVELTEHNKLQDKLADGNKDLTYNPYADDMDCILPQYNDKVVDDPTKSFKLNDVGDVDRNSKILQILDNDDGDGDGDKPKLIEYDLTINNNKIESDYYSVKFKKKRKKKKKKKDKKRKRNKIGDENKANKKRRLNDDGVVPIELEQEYMDDKYAFLADGDDDKRSKSRGKRDDILNALKLSEIEEKEKEERIQKYNIALAKANQSMIKNIQINKILNELNDDNSDNDDKFMNTLQRAKILQNKHSSNNDNPGDDGDDIDMDMDNNNHINVINDDGSIVFTKATQFSDGLCGAINQMHEDDDIYIKNQDNNTNGEYDIENATIVDNMDDNENTRGGWIDPNDKNGDADQKQTKKSGGGDDGTGVLLDSSILDREPLCSGGIYDTLQHIRRRGYLLDDDDDIFGLNDNTKKKQFKPSSIGLNRASLEKYLKWDVSDVLLWLKKSNIYLYNKYHRNFELKRIDGFKLINSCSSTSFLRGVIGMKNNYSGCGDNNFDISKFLNILGELKGDPAPDISLSHQDEYGKPMTAKEAFRKLSHKFHGKKSGPKKQEKRLKKRKEEIKRKISMGLNIDTPLGTLSKLKQTTKSINKPFVILDKN